MTIPPITAGLAGTSSAIQRGQARFDAQAQQVADASLGLTGDAPTGDDSQLPAAVVGLEADAISNSLLYKVFQRQAEAQRELADLLKPPA